MKTIIERGASWTLEETKMLLALWGQDLVQRQKTNQKRTKEVYEKISEKFIQSGFERTADQVRTRVFNMIAEYRRILKDPNPERMKKCIFFEALHKIYNARHMDDVKSALDDYEPEYPYSPASNTISSDKGDESVSDGEATDGNETINNNSSAQVANSTANNATNTIGSNNSITTDNNNGDSNNNNNNSTEKESTTSTLTSQAPSASGTPAKKIKLESPKSSSQTTNQSNQAGTPAASTSSASSTSSSSEHTNSKQQTKSTSTPLIATTIGGASLASSSSTASSSQRHQSLLLPHATTSSSSTTPISKLTTAGNNNTPSYINIKPTQLPIIRTNQLIGHSNGNDSINMNGTAARLPTTAAITSHQLYQAPVNTFDVTSSALLIDRMFAHLSRESENMREWIALEKERLALERARRQQETEREVRRERILIDTLMRFQEQWLSFLSRLDPRIVENAAEDPPELKVPARDSQASVDTSQSTQQSTVNSAATPNTPNPTSDAAK